MENNSLNDYKKSSKPDAVKHESYAKELSKKQIIRLREITNELPSYVKERLLTLISAILRPFCPWGEQS